MADKVPELTPAQAIKLTATHLALMTLTPGEDPEMAVERAKKFEEEAGVMLVHPNFQPSLSELINLSRNKETGRLNYLSMLKYISQLRMVGILSLVQAPAAPAVPPVTTTPSNPMPDAGPNTGTPATEPTPETTDGLQGT